MCQLKFLTILFVVGLSQQTLPLTPFSLNTLTKSKATCTLPDPDVSFKCEQGVADQMSQYKKCTEDKQAFWSEMLQGAQGDNNKLILYGCCAINDMVGCMDALAGPCTDTEINAIKQWFRDCTDQESGGVLKCTDVDYKSCPSGSHKIVISGLSIITLLAAMLYLNKTQF